MKTLTNTIAVILIFSFVFLPAYSIEGKPKKHSDLDLPALDWSQPQFSEFDLSNGIAGLVVEDNEVPLVDFYIAFPSPSDPADKVGLADMTTWALRNGGSVNIPPDSLNDIIEFKAAYFGVYAGQEQLLVYGLCLRDDFEFILNLTRELIDNPAYPEDIIELHRGTMLEQIRRSNDRPASIGYREIYKLLYPDHPWGREESVGSVEAITREDVTAYHQRVFQPEGAVFGIAGDISHDEAQAAAEKYLSSLTGSGSEIESLPAIEAAAEPGIYYAEKDVEQAYIFQGHQTIDYNDPRRHAATIMNYVLGGGGFQSILLKKIRVDEGLAYSVYSSFSTPVPVVGTFHVVVSTKPSEAGRTMTLIDETIKSFIETGPTEEQFDKAMQAYLNSYVWKYEDSDDILSRLVYLKWRGLPLDTPQRDLEALQKLTIEDVRSAAKELLHPDKMIKVVVSDKTKMDQPLESFGTVHELDISAE